MKIESRRGRGFLSRICRIGVVGEARVVFRRRGEEVFDAFVVVGRGGSRFSIRREREFPIGLELWYNEEAGGLFQGQVYLDGATEGSRIVFKESLMVDFGGARFFVESRVRGGGLELVGRLGGSGRELDFRVFSRELRSFDFLVKNSAVGFEFLFGDFFVSV